MPQHAKTTDSSVSDALKRWSPLHAVLIGVLFVGLLGMTYGAAVGDSSDEGGASEAEQAYGGREKLPAPQEDKKPEGYYLDPIFKRDAAGRYAGDLNVENASGEATISIFTVDSAAEPLSGEGSSFAGSPALSVVEGNIAAFVDEGYDVGFVVLDLQTGKGLSYNADGSFFSASTVKAPFVTFVSQDMLDTGNDSKQAELDESTLFDEGGVIATDDQYTYTVEEVITYTIENSDNNGYGMLRDRYEEDGFEGWVESAGVSAEIADAGWFPYYSPRDLAKLWLKSQEYFDSGAENAAWCEGLFSQTQLSFIREAIGDHAEVHAKAGYEIGGDGGGYWYYDLWGGMTYAGGGYSLAALNDAGIVSTESGDYLIVVLTNADFDEYYLTDNEPKMVSLIQALDAARNELLAS